MVEGQVLKSQCLYCKHLDTKNSWTPVLKCGAYKTKVPLEIIRNEIDHTKPYKGDNGIQFEPIEDE